MSFDPDTFLAEPAPAAPNFDPNAFLKEGDAPPAAPDWKALTSGVDEAHSHMPGATQRAFAQLADSSDNSQDVQKQAINMGYVKTRLPQVQPDFIQQNWGAVKDAFAQNALGLKESNITDSRLYQAIHENEVAKQVHRTQEYADASPFKKLELMGPLLAAYAGQRVSDQWDAANKPFVALPEAPQMPDLPGLGTSNPALLAGVYNGVKPLIEGIESPVGVAAIAGGGILKAAPVGRAILTGISGLFTALMAKSTYDQGKQITDVFHDPKATLQDKIKAVSGTVATGAATLAGALHTVTEVLPSQAVPKLVADLKGKTPGEAANTLRQEASQQKELAPVVAMHEAADHFEALTEKAMDGQDEAKPTGPAEETPSKGLATVQKLNDGHFVVNDAEGRALQITDSAEQAKYAAADASGVDLGERDQTVSDGSGTATPYENEMLQEWQKQWDEQQKVSAPLSEPPDLSAPKGSLGTDRPLSIHYGIIDPRMAKAMDFIKGIGIGAKNVWNELRSIPEFGKFKQIINEFNGEQQARQFELAKDVRKVFEAVPDKLTRRAMYRAIEAGFDKKQLQEWAKGSTRASSKAAYEAALKLTPKQIEYARKVKAWFEAKHPQAVQAGLLDPLQKLDNYVPLMSDQPYDVTGKSSFGGKLKGDFSHAIARNFENSFELENATDEHGENLGLSLKTDDLPEVMASYGSELDKVDLTRQALKALESQKALAEDGQPLVKPVHGMLTADKPDVGSTISNPSSVTNEAGVKYETLDHPAFKRFYFAGNDAAGKPVMFKGEMGLHPEIYDHLANILGRSKIQNWMDSPGGAVEQLAKTSAKVLQESQKAVKANMFSASVFHATHIATRAAGNLVAPWEVKPVDVKDPAFKQATRLGLQLIGDNAAMNAVAEGLGGGSKYNVLANLSKFRGEGKGTPGVEQAANAVAMVGDVVNKISHVTFHDIIPAYKLETWKQLNAKNLKLFSKDIAKGKVTEDQVGYLTSTQVNARFGEQNYNDLGLNPTWKHILSLTTLAPDFWRSNLQNFKEVAVGLTGAKAGREPAKAFAITAGVTWLAARLLNKALSDEDSYHFEDPFAVHVGNRTYSFRTEVQDIQTMATKPAQYMMGRLAPFASSALEYLSQTNWRGEKVEFADVLKEMAGKAIPASIKFLPGVSEADEWATGHRATTSHFEQFLTAQGIKVGRSSPLNAAYALANDYKKSIGKDEKQGVYPISKYQQLRYALEDGDQEKAKAELAKLIDEKHPVAALSKGLHSSIFHPWVGTHELDHDFKASLDKEDLAKVQKAEAHRKDIWAAFQKLSNDHSP